MTEPATLPELRDQIRGARKQRPIAVWTSDHGCGH
jgi:hypothetical protein